MKKCALLIVKTLLLLFAFTACGSDAATAQSEDRDLTYDNTHQHIDNQSETIALRFYYHDIELDPNLNSLPEAFLYNTEEIKAQNLREEFIRLMYEHTGISILDLWFEEDKLYVNLSQSSISFFDNFGTAVALRNLTIFEKSLLSIPGIAYIEVLVSGQYGFEGSYFSFGHVAIVENNEIVKHNFYKITQNDLCKDEPLSPNPVQNYLIWEGILDPSTRSTDNTDVIGIHYVDFIFITNGDSSAEPLILKEGNSFNGLTLEMLTNNPTIVTLNNQYFDWFGIAAFSGYIVARGDLTLWEDPFSLHSFRVNDMYLNLFPKIVNDSRDIWFAIDNDENLLQILGVSSYTIENNSNTTFENVLVRIKNYTIQANDGGAMNRAEIVEILE